MTRPKIGFIGGGNMGAAIMAGLCEDYTLAVTDPDVKRTHYLKKQYRCRPLGLEENVNASGILIIAVKPQHMEPVLKEIHPFVTQKHLLISIAAGITTAFIEKRLPQGTRVIRAMPNLPVQVGYGMTGLCEGSHLRSTDMTQAGKIFSTVGDVAVVEEKQMDALTAVSGSGPAYVYYFMECLQASARKMGLPDDLAAQLVGETLLGSLMLLIEQGLHPAETRQAVTSKGGTTEAALNQFQKEKFSSIIEKALKAAQKRAKELSK